MAAQEHAPARGHAAGAPHLLEEQLLGITSMAVIVADDHGRVSQWSDAAQELFGVGTGRAAGRRLWALLRLPLEHQEVFEPGSGRLVHSWTGVCLVPRVDDGELQEIAWWVYPMSGYSGVRTVAIAVDARRLRDDGHGLALGDLLVVPPPSGPLTGASGLRVLRVEPTFLEPVGLDTWLFRRRLKEMMPPMDPGTRERIIDAILASGYPSVNVSFTARLPFAPAPAGYAPAPVGYEAAPARKPAAPGTQRGRRTPRRARHAHAESLEDVALTQRIAFLNEATAGIGQALDPVQTATEVCEVMVPRFADFAGVHLIERIVSDQELPPERPDDSTKAVRAAVRHNDPHDWDDVVPVGEVFALPPRSPFVMAMKTGEVVNISRLSEEEAERISADFDDRDLRPLIQDRAMLAAPLIARGTVFGDVVLLRKADRPPFDETDVVIAEALCRRVAVCIDNGRLYQREARAVGELQRSMLPDAPPVVAGAEICYRYVPAGRTSHVGGDWFDAIPLPGSRIAFVVGDVMGHGLNSAAIMGQLRTAVRTLAVQELPPDLLLRQLDDLAQRLGEDCIATCLYVVYDPVARRCEVASAGHLPPVLISPAGFSDLLDVPTGAPIGVGGVAFETVGFDAEDESRLVLCTDGLVERRGHDIEAGLIALRDELSGPPRSLEAMCQGLIKEIELVDPPDDDVALLAVRFEGIPKEDVATWTLRAEPTMVRRTRELSRGVLETWGLGELAGTVELLVSELVTNALMHGEGEIGLRLIKAASLLCEVHDDGNDLPYLCHAEATDENGRGLQLVAHLADRWGTHRTPNGKVVWFENALPPATSA